MTTFAITGGIGSGKSFVSSFLRDKGYEVYDTDSRAKQLMEESAIIRSGLIQSFGANVYDHSGKLNRALMAKLIFQNETNLQYVNSIVHPEVRKDLIRWITTQREKMVEASFFECAILFQAGFDDLADKIILVTADYDVRLQRVQKRDQCSLEKVEERIRNQISDDFLRQHSDIIIQNSTEIDARENILRQLIQNHCIDPNK